MAKNNYSDETKAAVIAALLEGQSVSKVAKDYNIPAGTVKSWKHREENGNGESVARVATEKIEMATLVIELLESHLQAAKQIALTITDPQYIRKQDASSIAVLLGVINDKAFRMLEALGRATDDHPPED